MQFCAAQSSTPLRRTRLEIRVISSLTPDDEARYAATFLKILAAVLDNVPITYAIHVELADGSVVHHSHGLRHVEPEDRPRRLAER